MLIGLIFAILQALILSVLYFGNISVDKPGYFGLASQHLFILAGTYIVLFLIGCIVTYKKKRLNLLLIQIVILLTLPLAYAYLKSFAQRVDSHRELLLHPNQKRSTQVDPELEKLGLTPGMSYLKAKEIMRNNGWILEASEDENSPYEKFPEVSCGEETPSICLTAWHKANARIELIVMSKTGNNPNDLAISTAH